MGVDIEFKDFSIQVKAAMNEAAIAFLHEAGGEVVAKTVNNSRTETGETKGSYQNVVDTGSYTDTVGSPSENAVWEEFGTGEYALNGDGRKGGWYIPEEKLSEKAKSKMKRVEIDGKVFYHTYGKTPSRALWKGFNEAKPKIMTLAEKHFKEKMK